MIAERTTGALFLLLALVILPAHTLAHKRLAVSSSTAHSPAAKKSTLEGSSQRQTAKSAGKRTSRGPLYVVLFVMDGGRPDYLHVSDIPHIRSLMQHGTTFSNAFAGILESETPSGHAAIDSGSPPSRDGILSFAWAKANNDSVNLFDPDVIRAGAMDRIMRQSGVSTIASLVHAANRHALVVALSGHKYYAADALGGPDADAIMYYATTAKKGYAPVGMPGHMPPRSVLTAPNLQYPTNHPPPGGEDHLAIQLAMDTFARLHQRVTLINLPEFDWPLGHVDGAVRDPALATTLMRAFDNDLGRMEDLYRRDGILNRTLFIVAADHGFAPIYHHVKESVIKRAVEAAGTHIVSSTYHTAAYIWINNKERAARAASNIAHLQKSLIQSVYFKEDTPAGYDYVRASGPQLFRAPGM